MKKIFLFVTLILFINVTVVFAQFQIPSDAILLDSTQIKSDGVAYFVEQRWKLANGQILHTYYDAEGNNEILTQKIIGEPVLTLESKEINISGQPGYREFKFGKDLRKMVQFCKIFKLGIKDGWRSIEPVTVGTPFLKDMYGNTSNNEYNIYLDLFDQEWILEKIENYEYTKSANKSIQLVIMK